VPILVEARPNARWSLDFVSDQFANGRRFRILTIVDDVTKECLGAIADTSISGRRVARELTPIIVRRGDDARRRLAAWVDDYNGERPHSSLKYQTPAACAANQFHPSPVAPAAQNL
jgi:transposase InsO family protein